MPLFSTSTPEASPLPLFSNLDPLLSFTNPIFSMPKLAFFITAPSVIFCSFYLKEEELTHLTKLCPDCLDLLFSCADLALFLLFHFLSRIVPCLPWTLSILSPGHTFSSASLATLCSFFCPKEEKKLIKITPGYLLDPLLLRLHCLFFAWICFFSIDIPLPCLVLHQIFLFLVPIVLAWNHLLPVPTPFVVGAHHFLNGSFGDSFQVLLLEVEKLPHLKIIFISLI